MPAVSPDILVSALLDAIQQSGGAGIYVSGTDRTHPRKFLIQYLDQPFSLWVYIWTLTPGGRVHLPEEYRIQITTIKSPLPLNPEGYTLLLGYHSDLAVFAGFDIERHRIYTSGSPSVQISIITIREALQHGLAFGVKANQEIAVGIRPDQLLTYALNAKAFHQYGEDTKTIKLLKKASQAEKIEQVEIDSIPSERQKVVSTVSTYSRAANFRQQVLTAYDHRCAVTRMQLKLVEAAHILPIPAPHSSDHVTNGLALSPTMHRAYDNCLIYLDEDYFMRLNNEKTTELSKQGFAAGLSQIKGLLISQIHLPADKNQWPNPKLIKLGNKYRRIPGYY